MISYYKLKKKIKDDARSNDGIAMILLVCIACAVLLGFHFVFKSPNLTIAGNKQYFLAQQFSEMIFAKIRRHINDPFNKPNSCVPNKFEDVVLDLSHGKPNIQNIDKGDWIVSKEKGNLNKCNKFFAKKGKGAKGRSFPVHLIDTYKIEINSINNRDILTKDITISIDITIVKMQGLNQSPTFSFKKSYIIKVMSLSKFGITFWGDASSRLTKEDDESKVYVHSPTFISSSEELDLESLSYEEPDPSDNLDDNLDPNIIFRDVVYTRSEKITNINDYIYFKKFYNKGIVTHVHNGKDSNGKDSIEQYIPKDNNKNWFIPIDYKEHEGLSYDSKLEESPDQTKDFTSLIKHLIVPGKDTPTEAGQGTCLKGRGNLSSETRRAIFINANASINIDLPIKKPDDGKEVHDHLFCGIIVAHELTVNLTKDGKEDAHYAMFGILVLSSLKVTGKGTLHIFNPLTHLSLPAEISAANAHTTDQPRTQLNRVPAHHLKKLLRASSANFGINLFLPMVSIGKEKGSITNLLSVIPPNEIFQDTEDHECKPKNWDNLEEACNKKRQKLYPTLGNHRKKPFYFIQENF